MLLATPSTCLSFHHPRATPPRHPRAYSPTPPTCLLPHGAPGSSSRARSPPIGAVSAAAGPQTARSACLLYTSPSPRDAHES
eukprot:2950359-Prymnesium_polylepis.1